MIMIFDLCIWGRRGVIHQQSRRQVLVPVLLESLKQLEESLLGKLPTGNRMETV